MSEGGNFYLRLITYSSLHYRNICTFLVHIRPNLNTASFSALLEDLL
jgi:hypothetical protein